MVPVDLKSFSSERLSKRQSHSVIPARMSAIGLGMNALTETSENKMQAAGAWLLVLGIGEVAAEDSATYHAFCQRDVYCVSHCCVHYLLALATELRVDQ